MKLKVGETAWVFIGEDLIIGKVNGHYDEKRTSIEDDLNTYCVYTKDVYATKEEAIEGMRSFLKALNPSLDNLQKLIGRLVIMKATYDAQIDRRVIPGEQDSIEINALKARSDELALVRSLAAGIAK